MTEKPVCIERLICVSCDMEFENNELILVPHLRFGKSYITGLNLQRSPGSEDSGIRKYRRLVYCQGCAKKITLTFFAKDSDHGYEIKKIAESKGFHYENFETFRGTEEYMIIIKEIEDRQDKLKEKLKTEGLNIIN